MRTTVCKNCSATIFWAKSSNGEWMPMDEVPNSSAKGFWLDNEDDGIPTAFMARANELVIKDIYTCHFDTCGKRAA